MEQRFQNRTSIKINLKRFTSRWLSELSGSTTYMSLSVVLRGQMLDRVNQHGADRLPAPDGMGSSKRLSILYVSQMPASPPRFGAQARMHGLMTELAKDHDLTAVMLVDDEF